MDKQSTIQEKSPFETKYKTIRENLPENFFKLLEIGWRIVPCSCSCGGEWAWIDGDSRMHGCVCHRTPR